MDTGGDGGPDGLYFGVFIRQYFVALTTTKLLVVKYAPLSTKRLDERLVLDRSEVTRATIRQVVLNSILEIESPRARFRLLVGRVFAPRGEELVRRLSRRPQENAG